MWNTDYFDLHFSLEDLLYYVMWSVFFVYIQYCGLWDSHLCTVTAGGLPIICYWSLYAYLSVYWCNLYHDDAMLIPWFLLLFFSPPWSTPSFPPILPHSVPWLNAFPLILLINWVLVLGLRIVLGKWS